MVLGLGRRRAATEDSSKEKSSARRRDLTLADPQYGHLMELRPSEGYLFHSDYFDVDDYVGCVLSFFHDETAAELMHVFWGISRIPHGLGDDVTVVILEQSRRVSESIVEGYVKSSEQISRVEENAQLEGGTVSSKQRVRKVADDMSTVISELQNGASYLHVHMRMFVKAKDVESMDKAIERISRQYVDNFATLRLAAHHGEQRGEMSTLLGPNKKKLGKGFHFTSVEFAGSYSLVTNGLNDENGEYVGHMVGDVNTSAMLFDVNGFDHHVVVADSTVVRRMERSTVANLWGSKISQSVLCNGGRVVHLIMDRANMDILGPPLANLTSRVDMNNGDVNMFEIFGSHEDEVSLFSAHMEKIVLMAQQAYAANSTDASIIANNLREIIQQFYVDQGMWHSDAAHNRDRLRLVGIPHDDVPRLLVFVAYLDNAYQRAISMSAKDPDQIKALNILRGVFRTMLEANSDLFNTSTSNAVDGAREDRRVIYDFSRLARRGTGVAMAQLVNVIGFAVDTLGEDDLIVVHGTETIVDEVKGYMDRQFEHLFSRGGRVAYLYNDIDKMLRDQDFNRFDAADYTIMGPMRDVTVAAYKERIKQNIPPDLEREITQRGGHPRSYLRRGVTNVVFSLDLALGVNPNRKSSSNALIGTGAA